MGDLMFGENLEEKEYTFPCNIITKDTYYEDHLGKRQTHTHILFIPQESSQTVFFYNAWLPSHEDQDYEVVAVVMSPFNTLARFSVNRANKLYEGQHLILMTLDSGNIREQILTALKNRSDDLRVNIAVQPASSEETFKV